VIGAKIAFETFGFRGNNLFIDNIEISNSVGLSDVQNAEAEVLIYPNPSEDVFNIILPDRKESILMSIRNLNGQEIWKEDIGKGQNQFSYDASGMPKGIYFISFVSNEMNITRKIVVR
jgi:hypothetical protein